MSNKVESYKVKDWTVFGKTVFKPPFKVSDSLINEARIVHVVQGNSILYSSNQRMQLSDGDTIIMKADNFVNNWIENVDGKMNEVIVFQFNSEFLRLIYENGTPDWFKLKKHISSIALGKIEPNELIANFFIGLDGYLKNPIHLTEEIICIKAKELISLLVQTDNTGKVRELFGDLFNPNSYNFQEVIQNHLYEDLNIGDLSFLTGMSESSFKRKFSNVYETSPNKYITSKRLEKAQTLLKTTDLRIAEIAYDCGFSDEGYFSKTFKKHFNHSPSEMRKVD